ncbi:hypothetical protein WKW80_27510 [Variovorax humicola]|uniref:Secreted protein n=1 Tax=Variovorax humicola TaxID=1769758 RepID=A0ABU8W6R1_9BURK
MNAFPIIKILTTTAVAWLLASATHAQSSGGGSRAEGDPEAGQLTSRSRGRSLGLPQSGSTDWQSNVAA